MCWRENSKSLSKLRVTQATVEKSSDYVSIIGLI